MHTLVILSLGISLVLWPVCPEPELLRRPRQDRHQLSGGERGREGPMEEGKEQEGERAAPGCWGLLSVLACAASLPSYVAWRGESDWDPTERKMIPDYSVRFDLLRRRRTNGRLSFVQRFNVCACEIPAVQQAYYNDHPPPWMSVMGLL